MRMAIDALFILAQNWELFQCLPLNGCIVAYSESVVLYNRENERATKKHNNLGYYHKHNAEKKKPDRKEYALYDSIYIYLYKTPK